MRGFAPNPPVVEVAPQPGGRLLHMPRQEIATSRVEDVIRRRAADIECDGRQRAFLLAVAWIESERDQRVANREIGQTRRRDAAALELVDERERPFVG